MKLTITRMTPDASSTYGDPCRVDNGFDQPSGYALGVGKDALRGQD